MIKATCFYAAAIILFSIFNSPKAHAQAASAWNPNTEKELYTTLYDASKQLLRDAAQRREWADCAIQKLKIALPNGIASVSQDSVTKLANRIGSSCAISIKDAVFVWSSLLEERIRTQLSIRPEFKNYNEVTKQQLINSFISKFQKLHPDGFSYAMVSADADKIAKECIAEISTKKP